MNGTPSSSGWVTMVDDPYAPGKAPTASEANSARLVLYPCDKGTGTPSGYHHFEAGPSRVVVCRYCGKKASA